MTFKDKVVGLKINSLRFDIIFLKGEIQFIKKSDVNQKIILINVIRQFSIDARTF